MRAYGHTDARCPAGKRTPFCAPTRRRARCRRQSAEGDTDRDEDGERDDQYDPGIVLDEGAHVNFSERNVTVEANGSPMI